MPFILAIIGVLLIVYWSAIVFFLFGREFYIQQNLLNTRKLQIQSKRTITHLLNEAEVKHRNSFIPPKPTDKPIFG